MTAKYVQIANMLRELIEKRAGDIFQLPTETALCQKYGVSHQTVRKALSVLEDEHLIIKRQGSGSYTTGLLNKENKNDIAILICSNTEYISETPRRFMRHATGTWFFPNCLCDG